MRGGGGMFITGGPGKKLCTGGLPSPMSLSLSLQFELLEGAVHI
jgi:hypothetical protein